MIYLDSNLVTLEAARDNAMFYMVVSLFAVLIFCIGISLIVGKEIKRLMGDNRTQREVIQQQRADLAALKYQNKQLNRLVNGELFN